MITAAPPLVYLLPANTSLGSACEQNWHWPLQNGNKYHTLRPQSSKSTNCFPPITTPIASPRRRWPSPPRPPLCRAPRSVSRPRPACCAKILRPGEPRPAEQRPRTDQTSSPLLPRQLRGSPAMQKPAPGRQRGYCNSLGVPGTSAIRLERG